MVMDGPILWICRKTRTPATMAAARGTSQMSESLARCFTFAVGKSVGCLWVVLKRSVLPDQLRVKAGRGQQRQDDDGGEGENARAGDDGGKRAEADESDH